MPRYVCIHGHFYQPPRENPWLEEVETEDSAAPYHDWNERIAAECYRPNAWSRVLDDNGHITRIVNNYARISFNFGPTLLSWLDRCAPDVYEAVLSADRESRARFSGHGGAIAQPFHHVILPLSSRTEKETQIVWGIRDFEARFGRAPEGMWFPETAVDLETLGVAAEAGIRFTILSPYQATRFRAYGASRWTTPSPEGIPTTRAYRLRLPHGRSIALFFYNGPLASDLAFHGLLHSGTSFAERLAGAFDPDGGEEPQLSHVATDGETYGHHHRHGDMALAFALERLEGRSDLSLTNYGEFLERHPPTYEVEIHAPSSWSCAHGVERWRSDCGCNTGQHPDWNQGWRTPLREALNGLRDAVRPALETTAAGFFRDYRTARLAYVDLIRDRSEPRLSEFLDRHALRPLSPAETTQALSLLETERQIEQMFTSCGWFFDELSGIETVQVLRYAARAVQLAEEVLGRPCEAELLDRLAPARSNLPELGDGRAVYGRFVRTARIGLRNVCAHYALSSLFEEYPETARLFCYTFRGSARRVATAGTARLAVGQVEVSSDVTRESSHFTYGALHIGGHNLFGGVRPFRDEEAFQSTSSELLEAFEGGNLPETIRRVDTNFGEATYTLSLLFRDEQRKIVGLLFESMRDGVETSFRRIYESTAPILRYLADSGATAPTALGAAAEFYLNEQVRRALERQPPDVGEVTVRLRELARMNLTVDSTSVGFTWARAAERLIEAAAQGSRDLGLVRSLRALVELAPAHAVQVDLSRVENLYFELARSLPELCAAHPGPEHSTAQEWTEEFRALGKALRIDAG